VKGGFIASEALKQSQDRGAFASYTQVYLLFLTQ
jgi:hypothetical protein